MKIRNLFVWSLMLSTATYVLGEDIFPFFNKVPISIVIPITTPGSMIDKASVVGTNYVYNLNGQIFTNSLNGHIPTVKEGFSGTTDRSTPWKTLTEMLAVYQDGCHEKKVRSIYADASKDFLDMIYTNSAQTETYKTFGISITNMQVLMGHDFQNGFLAYIKLRCTNGVIVTPVFLTLSHGDYLLSSAQTSQTNLLNILAFLSSDYATNLIR